MKRPWTEGVDVTEYTHRDLEERRSKTSGISDSSFALHRDLEGIRRHYGFDNLSETVDFLLRIELARLIDDYEVSFSREDYGIAYMIPSVGWYEENIDPIESPSDVETDFEERSIPYSTTPTVFEMTKAAVEETETETITKFVTTAAWRLLE